MSDPFRDHMRSQNRRRRIQVVKEYTPLVIWVQTEHAGGNVGQVREYLRDEAADLPFVSVPDSYYEPPVEVVTPYDDEIGEEEDATPPTIGDQPTDSQLDTLLDMAWDMLDYEDPKFQERADVLHSIEESIEE